MQSLTIEQTADFLKTALIEGTIDNGTALAHVGISCAGVKFILVNDMFGETALMESI